MRKRFSLDSGAVDVLPYALKHSMPAQAAEFAEITIVIHAFFVSLTALFNHIIEPAPVILLIIKRFCS